mmetsp:Transcript_12147/g.25124  ORF Transcript_12147/g.25124 Transcript_12147/m.25124 type:complete len:119 (-) Transcript_12147:863-1219(-)
MKTLVLSLLLAAWSASFATVEAFRPSGAAPWTHPHSALMPTRNNPRANVGSLYSSSNSGESSVCEATDNELQTDFTNRPGSGKLIRQLQLTNINGELVTLGDKMGQGMSMVVFLRHLG